MLLIIVLHFQALMHKKNILSIFSEQNSKILNHYKKIEKFKNILKITPRLPMDNIMNR